MSGECSDILSFDGCFDAVKLGATRVCVVLEYLYVAFAIKEGVASALTSALCPGPGTVLVHLCRLVVMLAVHSVSQDTVISQ